MGRDVAGLRIEKKPNNVTNPSGLNPISVHVDSKIAVRRVEKSDSIVEDYNAVNMADENGLKKHDTLAVKSTNCENGLPDQENSKLISVVTPSESVFVGSSEPTSSNLATPNEKKHSSVTDAKDSDGVIKCSDKPMAAAPIQELSPLSPRKDLLTDDDQYHENDNISVASFKAKSTQASKFKTTVPIAPKFVCGERLSRRMKFYTKLEEKRQTLEAEKLEIAAKIKEEEEEAIKQLRKSLVYKANPVPDFYREKPSPKAELKKLPVTRAISPKLTRRKSCINKAKSSPDTKGTFTKTRKEHTSALLAAKDENAFTMQKVTEVKEKSRKNKRENTSILEEETNSSSLPEHVTDISVIVETRTSPTSNKDNLSTDIVTVEEGNEVFLKVVDRRAADIALN